MPDRSDAEQEGLANIPTFAARMLARDEAEKVILQHLNLCPFANLRIEERVRNIETNFARLSGFMIGSGLLGGGVGAIAAKLMGG